MANEEVSSPYTLEIVCSETLEISLDRGFGIVGIDSLLSIMLIDGSAEREDENVTTRNSGATQNSNTLLCVKQKCYESPMFKI